MKKTQTIKEWVGSGWYAPYETDTKTVWYFADSNDVPEGAGDVVWFDSEEDIN